MMKRPSFINFFFGCSFDERLSSPSFFLFRIQLTQLGQGRTRGEEKGEERFKKKKTTLFFLKYCHRVVRVGLEKRKETTRAISSVFSLPHAPGARALTTRACENGMVVDRQIRFFFPQDGPFFGVFFVYGSALSFRNAMTTKVLLRLFCFVLVQ